MSKQPISSCPNIKDALKLLAMYEEKTGSIYGDVTFCDFTVNMGANILITFENILGEKVRLEYDYLFDLYINGKLGDSDDE